MSGFDALFQRAISIAGGGVQRHRRKNYVG